MRDVRYGWLGWECLGVKETPGWSGVGIRESRESWETKVKRGLRKGGCKIRVFVVGVAGDLEVVGGEEDWDSDESLVGTKL